MWPTCRAVYSIMWVNIHRRLAAAEAKSGCWAHIIERMSRNDLVRHHTLPVVRLEKLCDWEVLDHHVGILALVLELRSLSRPTQEEMHYVAGDTIPRVVGRLRTVNLSLP